MQSRHSSSAHLGSWRETVDFAAQVKHPNTTYCLHGYSTQQRKHEALLELHTGASLYLSSLWITLICSKSTRLVAQFQFYAAPSRVNGALYCARSNSCKFTFYLFASRIKLLQSESSLPGDAFQQKQSRFSRSAHRAIQPRTITKHLRYRSSAALLFWCSGTNVHHPFFFFSTSADAFRCTMTSFAVRWRFKKKKERNAVASDQGIDLKSSAKFTNVQI